MSPGTSPSIPKRILGSMIILVVLHLSCYQEQEEKAPPRALPEYGDPTPMPEDTLAVPTPAGRHGGRIVTAMINDPKTFHQLLFSEVDSQTFNQLMSPGLMRLNLFTQQPEPALAKSWESSSDHLTWTFHLRKGLLWSDGQPFSAADILFTMQIVNDPKIPSSAQDALTIAGKPVQWKQIDDHTVAATLPSPFASFLRQLDGATVPIVAKHKWEQAYREGKFQEVMQVSMNPNDFVALGPFRLKEYRPGQRVTLARNPNYWKMDKNGRRLPYLDEITFLIVSDLNQLQLKIESGEIDTYYSIRPEDVERIKQKGASIGLKVFSVGPTLDFEGLFFNQNGDRNPKTAKPYVDPVKRSWFTDTTFRKAVSYAIDRNALIQNAFYGKAVAAYGPESISNKLWYNDNIPKYPYDPAKALQLLQTSGFVQKKDVGGKSRLYDRSGHEVRFSLHTNSGNTIRNTECNLIASDLDKLGIRLEYTALDFNTLVTRVTEMYDYDAILLALSHDDVDPSAGMNVMLSSGMDHFWWPQQEYPHTLWEKRVDELMNLQMATFNPAQRKRYYDEVQQILADQQPMIYTVTQFVYVCAKERLGNLQPTVSRHRTLWNADELYWKQ